MREGTHVGNLCSGCSSKLKVQLTSNNPGFFMNLTLYESYTSA